MSLYVFYIYLFCEVDYKHCFSVNTDVDRSILGVSEADCRGLPLYLAAEKHTPKSDTKREWGRI